MDKLLAKSKRKDEQDHPSMFLLTHLQDVFKAATFVLAATGKDQLVALGVDPAVHFDRFARCTLLSAALHDIGKANDHFLGMLLRTRKNLVQGVRHEWISILIINKLREWFLSAVSENDLSIVEWAVAGHHPSVNHLSPPYNPPPDPTGPSVKVYLGHPDFVEILKWLSRQFGFGTPPSLGTEIWGLGRNEQIFPEIRKWKRRADDVWELFTATERRLTAAVKCCLVAADVSGSALPKKIPDDNNRWLWISDSFAKTPVPGEIQAIVNYRAKNFLKNAPQERFQIEVANSKCPATYVKSGCGTGKTQAAYMWAAKNHPTKRLYFCYPTTGTATEGYKDYLHNSDGNVDLFHSRRKVDLEIILGDKDDDELTDRIESLDSWSTAVVACTVDTVLGLMQNNRRGIFSWPALAQSAFVFDEIHSYDDCLFANLLSFLKNLPGVPCLLMTASLPRHRENDLTRVLKECRGIDLVTVTGPKAMEDLPRYKKITGNPFELAKESVDKGEKVLWICNTVNRVMETARIINSLVYHSRFKYEHRVLRHEAVINAFQKPGALAVCSQVAEMSLDLSADLLIMDLAPIPPAIQRLGRLNRRAKQGDATKPFLVVQPPDVLPYTDESVESAKLWLNSLPDEISQSDLVKVWKEIEDKPSSKDEFISNWIDGGPQTRVTQIRNGENTITVLMEEDLEAVRSKPESMGKFTIPMLKPKLPLQRERGIFVAPKGTIKYSAETGAEWR